MLKLFAETHERRARVTYDQLHMEVFDQAGHEIQEYSEIGLLRYCWPLLGSNRAHEIMLAPMSPRFLCAFRLIVNKSSLKKTTLEVQQQLERIKLIRRQRELKSRIDTMLSLQKHLTNSTESQDLEKSVIDSWHRLRQNWLAYDQLSPDYEIENEDSEPSSSTSLSS